ncbi:tyrosine-type recombinase/integrase [Streptococcus himalayensis]|uniref:Integrase - phage associated n=1 Tax=Streptococcus himalayensis TaxID=1888195 RepID=A0A917A4X3_9STRE|nr:site-specific integrase [Streptococcus himalayensis]GGE25297.1 putative integrase - phage associated [Streptococcus himalayensis]
MKINEIKKKNGTTVFRANIYLGVDRSTGKKVKTNVTARTKTELRKAIKQRQVEFEKNGSTVQKKVSVKTFKELTSLWLDSYKLTVKLQTYKGTVSQLNCHVLPVIGDRKVDKITSSDIQVLINELSTYFENYKAVRSAIRRIFQYGILLGIITLNPARDIILPRSKPKDTSKVKFIEPEHLKDFLDNIEKIQYRRYGLYFEYVLYNLLLSTGLRISEACALEWSDIDLEEGTISVSKTFSRATQLIDTTKTNAGNRTISIDGKTKNTLRLYQVRQRQVFFEHGARASSVVFATPTRKYFDTAIRQHSLDTRCKEAGVPRFTFHAFRHTHASLLLNAGISYKELQYRLGHANISMTLDVYSHLSKDKEKEAVSYFEKAISSL